MPIIKSAKKRVRIANRATARNVKTKRNLRTAIKSFGAALGSTKAADAQKQAQSALDKAGKKNIMHKNKVARKQRQLAAQAKAAGVKITGKKAAAKPVAKKPLPTQTSKKEVSAGKAKKAPAKKPAAKK